MSVPPPIERSTHPATQATIQAASRRRLDDAGDLVARLRDLASTGAFDLPPFGAGHTSARLHSLARIAADDLALARLAEAHLDAVTILREAGRAATPGALYGVWASDVPNARLEFDPHDALTVSGRKAFCTGAGVIDRALVTVHRGGEVHLVELDAGDDAIVIDTSGWITPAFAGTRTATITVPPTRIDRHHLIGPADWYLDRVGFWHGALAPAACWAGGAIGLADRCLERPAGDDPHLAAHLGSLDSARWALHALLGAAGDAVDRAPHDHAHAFRLAHRMRAAIELLVTDVIGHAMRGFGPRLLAHDLWGSTRIMELQLYIRQHHDTRDHAALGRVAAASGESDARS